ncbi:type IV secretion system DNA-binding domain-containing protein [Acidobacteria bacterium AH-259-G07]|nr:type IV secretion system DNA-binding domain-containing protein [Acidobacteria bacterium AH-259-G07]
MTTRSDNRVTFFGQGNYRDYNDFFGIRRADRLAHMYIIGKTGTGKTTLLETMVRQDIENGEGFALLDPHGDLIERVLPAISKFRPHDVVYFNVPDLAKPLGFNPLERVPVAKRPLAASGLLEAFKKIWDDSWGPRTEHILRNALLALLDQPEATLADILRLLDDYTFRMKAMTHVSNEHVKDFWLREYKRWSVRFRSMAIAPIENKVGAFLANPLLHRILTQPKSAFDVRQLMDEKKILLVNLAKGKIGEDTAALLGSLLVATIGFAALRRADVPEKERQDFYLYLDEFQNFTTLSLANMLSEVRKYKVGLVLAHQYISQLDTEVRDAILGNVGTIISFRIGMLDTKIIAGEFSPDFSAEDLIRLPNYHIYLKLMIDGVVSRAFSAVTLLPR